MNMNELTTRTARTVAARSAALARIGLTLALCGPALAQAQEETVSRAEHHALRQELEALRAEVETLRDETREMAVEVHATSEHLEGIGRFAPSGPSEQVTTWSPVLTFTSPDDRFSLSLRGRIQPRYEYERRDEGDSHSSFSIRRIRFDFRGHAYTKDLTWRIMPEWNRTGTLRDGWVDYKFSESVQLRAGQYQPPFSWERDASSNRHQFVERSIANEQFEFNDGRDLGVMVHGKWTEQVRYGAGIFGGEGRNVSRTSSEGHLYTGRVTYAPVGKYPDSEALTKPIEGQNLAFGIGAGYNNKNTSELGIDAHIFSGTADAHLQADRFSGHLIGFYRDVDPRAGQASFDGRGLTVHAGYLLVPDRLFANLRYSYAEPNTDQNDEKRREAMAGLHIYHFGHGSKVQVEAGRLDRHDGTRWLDTEIVRVQYQLLF